MADTTVQDWITKYPTFILALDRILRQATFPHDAFEASDSFQDCARRACPEARLTSKSNPPTTSVAKVLIAASCPPRLTQPKLSVKHGREPVGKCFYPVTVQCVDYVAPTQLLSTIRTTTQPREKEINLLNGRSKKGYGTSGVHVRADKPGP